MKKIAYIAAVITITLLQACKKEKVNNNNTSTSAINMLKDSVYLYDKEDYLWNDAIPAYGTFNPRAYTGSTDKVTLSNELFAISQLKINPSSGKPYEYSPNDRTQPKYSFIDDGSTTASLKGTNADYGFSVLYIAVSDLRIKYVYPGSPAALAGLTRGDIINSINGKTNISYDNGSNVNYVVQAIFYSTTLTMGITKLDGSSATINLTAISYTVNPVLTYKVFNVGGGHIVGYLAFNSFTALANAQPKLNEAFNYYISNGVNDLVVDLRYNGGGAGETAEYLDDLIAPASKTGTLMYTTYFNSGLQNNNYTLFAKKFSVRPGDFLPQNNQVMFKKALTLSLNRVFFIVTNESASSSELTINNLRPELNVQLIGDTTYGKPVGEIPIPIGNYVLYSPQLSVENSANQGDYYTGFAPGSASSPGKLAADDVTKDFGDSTEVLLAHALHFVKSGTYAINSPRVQSLNKSTFSMQQQSAIALKLDPHKFKGLVLSKKFGKKLN
jgi:carboxyl-terminal processing protease